MAVATKISLLFFSSKKVFKKILLNQFKLEQVFGKGEPEKKKSGKQNSFCVNISLQVSGT